MQIGFFNIYSNIKQHIYSGYFEFNFRLIKSLDQLGKQIASQSESGLHHQRLISGGLGLDVWDLTNAKNVTAIIGLKVCS